MQKISFFYFTSSFIPIPFLAITKEAPIWIFNFILLQNLFLAIQLVQAGFIFITFTLFLKAIFVISLSYRVYDKLCNILLYCLPFLVLAFSVLNFLALKFKFSMQISFPVYKALFNILEIHFSKSDCVLLPFPKRYFRISVPIKFEFLSISLKVIKPLLKSSPIVP